MSDDFRRMLDFAVDKTVANRRTYSDKQILESKNYSSWISEMNTAAINSQPISTFHITSKIMFTDLFLSAKHILLLDCDSEDKKNHAVQYLNESKIGHVVVMSSYSDTVDKNRYWILCDYIKDAKSCIDMMGLIPGVDPLYFNFCKQKSIMNLRGYPKNYCVPLFGDMSGPFSEEFNTWASCFKSHWKSSEMEGITRLLSDRVKDRSVLLSIGRHLSPEVYDKVQRLINKDYEENLVYYQRKEAVLKKMNALYGMEVADED